MNLETNTVWDALTNAFGGDMAMVVVLSIFFLTLLILVIAVIVSRTICRVHKNQLDNALKRELIDRGFSVDEIERIVQSQSDGTVNIPPTVQKS